MTMLNMEKQIGIIYLLFGLFIIVTLLHKFVFRFGEPESFIFIFPFAFGFTISVIQNTIRYLRKGFPKDLWKIGFLGVFGLIGLIPGFSNGFFGFIGFIGFFGAKRWSGIKKKIR